MIIVIVQSIFMKIIMIINQEKITKNMIIDIMNMNMKIAMTITKNIKIIIMEGIKNINPIVKTTIIIKDIIIDSILNLNFKFK